MAQFTCPHCRAYVDVPFALAGSVSTCDACGGQFTIPASVISYAPEPPPTQMPPVIVVSHGSQRYERPMRASGWFSRSFASAAGCLTAFMLFNLLALIAVIAGVAVLHAVAENSRAARQPVKVSRSR